MNDIRVPYEYIGLTCEKLQMACESLANDIKNVKQCNRFDSFR